MPAKRTKGSGSRLYSIHCAACGEPILRYQKDGPGGLLRMYLDRILTPPALAGLQHRCHSKDDMPNLVCPACNAVIAVPMVHDKGKRLAFRIIKGRSVKKRRDR